MKRSFLILALMCMTSLFAQNEKTIYQFKVEDINGETFDLSSLKGKKVMIVNTASKCGYTPQYAELQRIYEQYKYDDFVIIGFPSNDFGNQEPGSNEEISEFCQKNYGVDFPMMAKITVKGEEKHPLYQFLTEKSKNGFKDSEVKWNFQKYLIDRDGKLVAVKDSNVVPGDNSILSWIQK
ncbi:glutathione peroxidase [Zunongwangia atlantica]|uniref:Glutathione peroxidase n=1 Tax=Zunongwangia atlantica 22II14-10F7 TaxID=1185767 RepID=A0A1Y1T7P7_9FLAO|nr:glutathione peroxidase [Zunongwangia atlantica]ORL47079.1 glutathione peroxidase [Zunongwangia atlantica 22II14-10F7]